MDKSEFEDFNPLDFLDFSCELNCKIQEFESSSSSVKRTIFSRSYYATFLCLRELLSCNTEYISNPYSEHRRLANFVQFKGPFDKKANKKLAKKFRILKRLRQQSDYHLEVPSENTKEYENWIFEDTDFAIDLANEIINQFKNRFKNS
ncbi:hypothetical protein [Methanobrevibacter sp.]|uniref:hypothetical protein n=1 Tax=Methanobrevibacter sp. TaxID=66852 RepID=UPI00388D7299